MNYDDDADRVAVDEQRKAEADQKKDWDYVLKEPRGRRWLHDLIFGTCHANSISHVPASSDNTAFNEGARSVGLTLLETVRREAPAKYLQMMEENHFDR